MRWVRLNTILLVLATVFLAASALAAQSLEDNRQALEEIRSRIKAAARKLEEKKATARSLGEDLDTLEEDIERLNRQISGLTRRDRELGQGIADKEKELAQVQARIDGLRKIVRKRLVALYKEGEAGPMSLLFSSRTPAHMMEEFDYMSRVLAHDRELLDRFRRDVRELQAARDQLAALQKEQQAVMAQVEKSRGTAHDAAKLKRRLLVATKNEEKALGHQLDTLRERARGLEKLVKKLESEKSQAYTGAGDFASKKGHLPWPVKGPVKVGFGRQKHPELGTMFDSQGIEIGVADGLPVLAVAEGRVIFANWFKGYGNLLIVDHGSSYYTLYAQNARLSKKVGDPVARGEAVGMSGLPGSDSIYFEIRHGGTPQNPRAWLSPP